MKLPRRVARLRLTERTTRTGSDPALVWQLIGHCERRLARFTCPVGVDLVDALPYLAIGKVRGTLLRLAPTPRPESEPTEVPDGR